MIIMNKYSFLDNDLYKLSMQNVVLQLFPNVRVKYKFVNRGKTVWPDGMAIKLREKIVKLSKEAILTQDEIEYLNTIRYFNPFFIWYLINYRFDPTEVHVPDNIDDLEIEGFWRTSILWECRILSMISELYYEMTGQTLPDRNVLTKTNMGKGYDFYTNEIKFAEFGTRRRFSFDNQDYVIQDLLKSAGKSMVGTSNVYFAKKYNLVPIGTMAHEMIMAHAAMFGFHQANKMALDSWIKVYKGDLGIALPDTFTTDNFLKDFNTYYAKLFDGLRQDSGNPIVIGNKILEHYHKLKLDEYIIKSRSVVFSDNLNSMDKILNIKMEFLNKIRMSFGIGTWLTNDIPGVKPLNIVIKLSAVEIDNRWVNTIKLSDDEGKYTGDPDTIDLAKRVFLNIK